MKKLIMLLGLSITSFSTLGNEIINNEYSSLFISSPNENVTMLSQQELSEIKGGVRSPSYTCSVCGAKHGGVFSSKVCYNCYNKGFRVNSIRQP